MVPTSSLSVSLFLTVCCTYVSPSDSFSLYTLNGQTKNYGGQYYNNPEASFRYDLNLASSSRATPFTDDKSNTAYINGLLQNLSALLDKYIMTGSMDSKQSAYNIMKQIEREALDDKLIQQGKRMVKRSGISLEKMPEAAVAKDDTSERTKEASERKKWESDNNNNKKKKGRSALSQREARNGKPDLFMSGVTGSTDDAKKDKVFEPTVIGTKRKVGSTLAKVQKHAKDKTELQNEMEKKSSGHDVTSKVLNQKAKDVSTAQEREMLADKMNSDLVAKAGAGSAFDGKTLGIGGLDDVLSQVKRRVWVPLAAPPKLLEELGILPVRGLLLYGLPGCGKTLLAKSLGEILSPLRPITVVSGPEIMDRFVGSSEANLRQIFDDPPDIYDTYRLGKDKGQALSKKALHVIVLDEFDAIARTRGGREKDGGSQGDAGVARDSVVNQLLAKMDGVDALKVPTLIIGLTNKRTLIEPALLRPGRFEVQIEVPPPRTVAQRVSILKVHTNHMYQSGRVLVTDTQPGTAAYEKIKTMEGDDEDLLDYEGLLEHLAIETNGMSGASLAGVARAAASHALERAVFDMSDSMEDCLVTRVDFENAIKDVMESAKAGDGGEIFVEEEEEEEIDESEEGNEEEDDDDENEEVETDVETESKNVEVKAEEDFTITSEENKSLMKAVGEENMKEQGLWMKRSEEKLFKAGQPEEKKPQPPMPKPPPKKTRQFKFNVH